MNNMEEMTDEQVADSQKAVEEKLANLGTEVSEIEIQKEIQEELFPKKLEPEKSTALELKEKVILDNLDESYSKNKPEAGINPEVKTSEEALPTLPNAYKRAAIHQEWTQEEIDEFYNADPEKALKTFAKLHDSNNRLSMKFSEFGNIRAQQEAEAQRFKDEQVTKPEPVYQPKPTPPVDMNELRRQYGNDPVVDIIQKLADQIADMKPVEKQPVRELQPDPVYQPYVKPQIDQNAAFRTLDNFFGSEDVKPYTSFYGSDSDWNKLSPGEFANRREVVQLAGSIVAGAEMKGDPMSDEMALEKAHLIVSQPYLEKAIVADIHTQLEKRAKSMTIRTSANKLVAGTENKTGSDFTPAERESRAQQRLDKIFKRI